MWPLPLISKILNAGGNIDLGVLVGNKTELKDMVGAGDVAAEVMIEPIVWAMTGGGVGVGVAAMH